MNKKKIVFCRIGWMENYKGIDDDCVSGGFEWVKENKYGHEMINFLPMDGYVYGYVRPQSGYINLERIDPNAAGEKIQDILVVFFAARPHDGQVIIGWYNNAIVFKDFQDPVPLIAEMVQEKYEGLIDCWIRHNTQAAEKDAVLLPVDDRRFKVPREKHFTGQSNIWYCDSDNKATQDYVEEVINYIENYKPRIKLYSKYFIQVLPSYEVPKAVLDKTNYNIIKDLKAKLQENPNDAVSLKKIADIHTDLGNFRTALKYIENALKITPDDWELYFWCGLCKEDLNDIEGAEKDYNLALEKTDQAADKALLINEVGLLYYEYRNDFNEAIRQFGRAILLDPINSVYHYNKASALQEIGDFNNAIESIVKAYDLGSDEDDVNDIVSQLYDKLRKTDQGKDQFRGVLSNCQNKDKLIQELSDYYLESGSKAIAKHLIEEYCDNKIPPDELDTSSDTNDSFSTLIDSIKRAGALISEISLNEFKYSRVFKEDIFKDQKPIRIAKIISTDNKYYAFIYNMPDGQLIYDVGEGLTKKLSMLMRCLLETFDVKWCEDSQSIAHLISSDTAPSVNKPQINKNDSKGSTNVILSEESKTDIVEDLSLFKEIINRPEYDISKERYLEEEIHRLIKCGLLFHGEVEVYEVSGQPYGRQFPTEIGRIDILCRNIKTNSLVVIEIKKGKTADQVIGQISRYMGYIRRNLAKRGQNVEGIIIAFDADKKLEYAMLAHDNIKVFTYNVNINELPKD